jgi:cell division protein FtsI (penicillin-binding protein 3)
MRSQALRSAAVRARALRLVMLVVFGLLAMRAGQLTLTGSQAIDVGRDQIDTRITLRGARGLIVDRGGRELAISVDAPSVFVLPQLLEEPDRALPQLARVLAVDADTLRKRIGERSRFTYLARWISDQQASEIERLDLPGVHVEREPRRTYPAGSMAAQFIGFANIDDEGVRGVEQIHDEWLRGSSHTFALTRDARGRLLSNRSFDARAVAGGDVMLSLHAGLQAQAEAALAEAVERTASRGGIVVAVDPRTGDILSLAEAPGFDPNDFRNTPYAATRSRAFLDAVEPGSTMKAFLVAAALDEGVISEQTAFDTGEGWIHIPGKTIRDHHPYGVIDVPGVLRYSSNVGAVLIAGELGPEDHYAALCRFGFGRTTGSGFPSESPGLLREWSEWRPVDHATVAFGQGMNVTAIQLAMATAALANEGRLMQPRIVMAMRRPGEPWRENEPVAVGRAVSDHTAQRMLGMLETVVSGDGTGRLAGLAGVRVAGKTGTAQVLDRESGRYSDSRYIAWFMGVAPADDPRVAIVVALDEPSGPLHTGGSTAAPLFAHVAAAQLAHQGILTEPEPVPAISDPSWKVAMRERERREAQERREQSPPVPAPKAQAASYKPASRAPEADRIPVTPPATGARRSTAAVSSPPPGDDGLYLVPDFHGRSLDVARRIAAQASVRLRVKGAAGGRVVRQSPVAGTIVAGSERTVVLSFSTQREEG